jgi:hypothetical protein
VPPVPRVETRDPSQSFLVELNKKPVKIRVIEITHIIVLDEALSASRHLVVIHPLAQGPAVTTLAGYREDKLVPKRPYPADP